MTATMAQERHAACPVGEATGPHVDKTYCRGSTCYRRPNPDLQAKCLAQAGQAVKCRAAIPREFVE
jgi:hypothetical protein